MIYIFLRTTLKNKFNNLRPWWFDYERCFKNILDTANEHCKLTVMFDGTEIEYQTSYLSKYEKDYVFDIKFITANGCDNSGIMTFEYIKSTNIDKKDLIYILENDYLHTDDWVNATLDLFCLNINKEIDKTYISLYSHPDKQMFNIKERTDHWCMYSELKSQIFLSHYRYWQDVPNTCSSFIMSKSLFDDDYDILSMREADNTRFHKLTSIKKRKVLMPLPGISTHLQIPYISPFVDWENINKNIKLL